jgi:hypothetical protein
MVKTNKVVNFLQNCVCITSRPQLLSYTLIVVKSTHPRSTDHDDDDDHVCQNSLSLS